MKPLVSIITVVYNGEKHLECAMKSVFTQDYDNIEYIIIDGNSKDKTVEIIKKHEEKIKYWISEPDKGIADAWNKGLRQANGEIIGILNSDDFYEIETVKKVVEFFKLNSAGLVYGVTKFIDEEGKLVSINNNKFHANKLYDSFGFMHTTCFLRKQVYDKIGIFNEKFKIAIDTEFLLRCLLSKVVFCQSDHVVNMRLGGISDSRKFEAQKEYYKALIELGFDKKMVAKSKIKFLIRESLKKIFRKNFIWLKQQIVFTIKAILNIVSICIPFHSIRQFVFNVFGIKIGANSYIHQGVRFFHYSNINIGCNSTINFGCYLDNRNKISIGNNVSIAHNVKIYTLGHNIDDSLFSPIGKDVLIEDYVCIFSNAIIMPGVKLSKGCVVLPGSVVVKDVPEYTVVGGNPAAILRKRNNDLQYKLNYGYWFAN